MTIDFDNAFMRTYADYCEAVSEARDLRAYTRHTMAQQRDLLGELRAGRHDIRRRTDETRSQMQRVSHALGNAERPDPLEPVL